MVESQAAPKRRIHWFIWVFLILIVGFITLFCWLRSDRDLVAVANRARSLGIAPTWEDLGVKSTSETALTDWRRLGQLATAVKSYRDSSDWIPRPRRLSPPGLSEHHAQLNSTDITSILHLCDELTPDSVIETPMEFTETMYPSSASWIRPLCFLLSERITLSKAEFIENESRRMLAVITAHPPRTLAQAINIFSCLALWRQALAGKAHDEEIGREPLAKQLELARTWLSKSMVNVLDDDTRLWFDLFSRAQCGESKICANFELSLDLPIKLRGYGFGRLWTRIGRERFLNIQFSMANAWRTAKDFRQRMLALNLVQKQIETTPSWQPSQCIFQSTWSAPMIHESWISTDMGLQVLTAELRNKPWPIDPTDPKGGTVRRILRDGRLIGFYMCGRNGVDDGGKVNSSTGDLCQALYEPLGYPMAADPPRDP